MLTVTAIPTCISCDTADEAWIYWYNYLQEQNANIDTRGGVIVGEALNAITVMKDPTRCIMTNDIRRMSMRYAFGEMLWYASANNSLDAIRPFTKAWDSLSDDGETANSNYGYCIKRKFGFDQLLYVMNTLCIDKMSRRAVIHIKEADDKPSKDVNCTICIQFFIREEKLYMTVYMRSNDLWLGFPYDVFNFAALQNYIAMCMNLKLGDYTHIAGSLHLYEKDIRK